VRSPEDAPRKPRLAHVADEHSVGVDGLRAQEDLQVSEQYCHAEAANINRDRITTSATRCPQHHAVCSDHTRDVSRQVLCRADRLPWPSSADPIGHSLQHGPARRCVVDGTQAMVCREWERSPASLAGARSPEKQLVNIPGLTVMTARRLWLKSRRRASCGVLLVICSER